MKVKVPRADTSYETVDEGIEADQDGKRGRIFRVARSSRNLFAIVFKCAALNEQVISGALFEFGKNLTEFD